MISKHRPNGFTMLGFAIMVAGSLNASAQSSSAPSTDPLATGSWLEGIQTRYVSDVTFGDIDFRRYRPFQNPYAAITHALENMPAEKIELAVSRYGTSIPDGLSPFHSQTKPFGRPDGPLTQRAEYHFKTACASCPELVTISRGSINVRFRAAEGKPDSAAYSSLDLNKIGLSDFEKYPFLREVLELHSQMLNARNTQSYVYRRERAIHHGMQAVLNFIQSRGIRLSPYASDQLEAMSKFSLNERLNNVLQRDIRHETGIDPTADHINLRQRWDDRYPFESLSGQSVLMRSIVDSVFESGERKALAQAIRENYKARRAFAEYDFRAFRVSTEFRASFFSELPVEIIEQRLGPQPKYTPPIQWWKENERWLPAGRAAIIVPTCDGSFINM